MKNQIAANSTLFIELDKKIDNFYNLLKEKNIEPKGNVSTVGTIEVLFNKTLNDIIDTIKKSSFDADSKDLLRYNLIVGFTYRTAEKYGFPVVPFASALSSKNLELYSEASAKLQNYM